MNTRFQTVDINGEKHQWVWIIRGDEDLTGVVDAEGVVSFVVRGSGIRKVDLVTLPPTMYEILQRQGECEVREPSDNDPGLYLCLLRPAFDLNDIPVEETPS